MVSVNITKTLLLEDPVVFAFKKGLSQVTPLNTERLVEAKVNITTSSKGMWISLPG